MTDTEWNDTVGLAQAYIARGDSIVALEMKVERLTRELAEAFDRGRAEGRADVAKYSRAIGEIEAALGIAGAVPMSSTVNAVRTVVAERDAARQERDALRACLPSEEEIDDIIGTATIEEARFIWGNVLDRFASLSPPSAPATNGGE